MKKHIFIFIICMTFNFMFSQAPNPPDKICFNYDKAGNRTAQIPAWLYAAPPIECQCNNPDEQIGIIRWWYIGVESVDLISSYIDEIRISVGDNNNVSVGVINYSDFISADPIISKNTLLSSSISSNDNFIFVLSPNILKSAKDSVVKSSKLVELSIVPNPNEGDFKVIQKGFIIEKAVILILDANGKFMFSREYLDGFVNISDYAGGTYYLILSDGFTSKTLRFIKK